MAAAEQLLEQMFSWLQQRENCAEQLREAAGQIEVGVSTSGAAASTQSWLPSDFMTDTHNTERKRKEISEIIQQLFQLLYEQLKAECNQIMERAPGSVFAHPELIDTWKDLIEKNHVTEASQSLRDTADSMTRMSQTLRGQFVHIKRMFEEMTESQPTQQSRSQQKELTGDGRLRGRNRRSRDKEGNKQDVDGEEEETEDQDEDKEGAGSTEDNILIRVALLNVRSMKKKTSQVKELITQNNLDVFCMTETWLKGDGADDIVREASPQRFDFCSTVRPGRGGGVVIQFSQEVQGKQIPFTCTTETFEFAAAHVKHDEWDEPVPIITLYRPPKSNLTQFLKEFEELLNQVSEKYNSIVVTGDFNVWFDDQSKGKTFKQFLQKYKLVQHIREATHHKGHTVDLVISRNVEISRCFVRDDGIADHHTVYFNMRPATQNTKKKPEESNDQDELINILNKDFGQLKINE